MTTKYRKLARLSSGEIVEFDFATDWTETTNRNRKLLGRGVIVQTAACRNYKSAKQYYFWKEREAT